MAGRPRARAAVGVDVGGTKVLGVAVDPAMPARPLAEQRVETPGDPEAIVDAIARVATQLAGGDPAALGVGIAGLVDRDGVVRTSPNIASLVDVPVREELAKRLGCTLEVHNDANVATWGEHRAGAAVGVADAVCITLGTGVGAGLVCGGEVVLGAHGFGGEAGHMVVDPTGPPCPCGRRGCWERFASGSGLARLARDWIDAGRLASVVAKAGGDAARVRGEDVAAAAHAADPDALAMLDEFGWWVALGIGNLVTLLDVGLVVVSGGLVEMGEPLLTPVRRHLSAHVMGAQQRGSIEIVPAALGERAGAVGAALLALHRRSKAA